MLTTELQLLLKKAIKQVSENEPEIIHLEETPNPEFGDFASNEAMKLSKKMGENPRIIAEKIIAAIPQNSVIKKMEVAGPGFINIWLHDEIFNTAFVELCKLIKSQSFGHLNTGKGKTAITDSSHPNIAKPMGVHHLLSTIIGQAINTLLSRSGYTVIRDNYIGDWGTQYGKLTYAIQTWGDMETIKEDPIPELLKLYVQFHDEAEKDENLLDKGREAFRKLEEGDQELNTLWQWIRDVSIDHCEQTWSRLGAIFDIKNGESFYEKMLTDIIAEGQKKGVITEGNEGALIIKMDDENKPPAIIRKKDGATLYATRDLARVKYWQDELNGDLGINVVDVAQKLYFEQLFESAEKMGFTKMKHIHVDFGRMAFPEGSMSTRKGKVVLLEDVLDEAEKQALQKIKDHNSELSEDDQKELARKLGIGAIKYNVLSQSRNKNYTFDWDVMLSFDGNSAPYLQYAYTRTQSILRKAPEFKTQNSLLLTPNSSEERSLLKKLLNYEPAIQRSLGEYKPNLLCTYLYELAQTFSTFYNNLRVIDEQNPQTTANRLKLVESTGYILKNGLEILGIEVPDRM
ncbi:MAG: arginine--tRNA ligase [Candidatus Gracilibacteria bacterium]|nr:arginine--tRNA ligase [Candidatus Gracilibacteria bacterium]